MIEGNGSELLDLRAQLIEVVHLPCRKCHFPLSMIDRGIVRISRIKDPMERQTRAISLTNQVQIDFDKSPCAGPDNNVCQAIPVGRDGDLTRPESTLLPPEDAYA